MSRSDADAFAGGFSRTLVAALLLLLLAFPSAAAAQRNQFFSELLQFYRTLGGVYGDEGPQLSAHIEAMSAALVMWDDEIRDWERQLRPRLNEGNAQTSLQVRTFLASLYMERGRFDEALSEFDEDIRLDSRRAAFPRFKGLIHQAAGRSGAAADAFWAAWLLDPADPQNAYRAVAFKSAQMTESARERALETLRSVEREIVNGTRPRADAPFVNISGIVDEVGGGMLFVPAAYARGFSLVSKGDLSAGVAALRVAAAADPLVTDAASRSQTMRQGIAALRQGRVAEAISQLEATVARSGESSEAHRILATACVVQGEIAKGLDHLRQAVRLNPRDERSWVALSRTLDQTGAAIEAQQVVRDAIAALPDAGALRWRLAEFAARQQRTIDADVPLITAMDRYVLLSGRADLYMSLARFARTQFDYQRSISLLEQAITFAPNSPAAHKALGRGYTDEGREDEGYAEFAVALMLDPDDRDTRIGLAQAHLAAGRADQAVALLNRAGVADGDRQAMRTLGEALVRSGRAAEGQARLVESERLQAQAVEQERRDRTLAILTLEADVRMTERDYPGAIDRWQQVIAMQKGSASAHVRLADALVSAKRLPEAAEAYETAISLDRAAAEVHRRLAEVYGALGRSDDAAGERDRYLAQQLENLRQRAAAFQ